MNPPSQTLSTRLSLKADRVMLAALVASTLLAVALGTGAPAGADPGARALSRRGRPRARRRPPA